VLLTLEAKEVPYQTKLVDLSNKPEWFVRLPPTLLLTSKRPTHTHARSLKV
jgi:hypothetical protein